MGVADNINPNNLYGPSTYGPDLSQSIPGITQNIPTNGVFDSFMESWKKMPWMSTPGTTVETFNSVTGLPMKTFNPGITGKFETLGGYGKGLLGAGSTISNIMGSLKQGKYVNTQMKALENQMKYARAQVGENYANQGARRAMNQGISAPMAYTTGDKYATDRMAKWGV